MRRITGFLSSPPRASKHLFEGGESAYAGWMDVPAWYIGTIEDQGLPVAVHRVQVDMAREMGEMAVPEARLWQPLTWFKFGLPLFFGHVLGRCILVFGWGRRLCKSS